jgi:hypothetical protein
VAEKLPVWGDGRLWWPFSDVLNKSSSLRELGAAISRVIVLIGFMAASGIVVAAVTRLIFVKGTYPNGEVAQADEPLLDFY